MSLKELLKVLVVDDDKNIANITAHFLRSDEWDVEVAFSGREGLEKIRDSERIAIVFLDLRLPDIGGHEVLRNIKAMNPFIDVIMITAHGTEGDMAKARKMGAMDFIPKPFTRDIICAAADRALRMAEMRQEVNSLRFEMKRYKRYENMVGNSKAMKKLYQQISDASNSDVTVLILGESGVGKDLVAKAIHHTGIRSKGPFVALNCAALPGELIESELFGYKKGAFTGASSDAIGLFRAAEGGTIFLDEIVEMPLETQAKLLRVLQDRKIRPVGGTIEIEVNARVICATNRNIQEALDSGQMRKDLYYRIGVITLNVPPLREHREDIPLLTDHFIAKYDTLLHKSIKAVKQDTMDVLLKYKWEGNVRELENVIQSAIALGKGPMISTDDLPKYILDYVEGAEGRKVSTTEVMKLDDALRIAVTNALDYTKSNVSEAAKILGITRKRLYRLISKYEVNKTAQSHQTKERSVKI